uniref:Uncharacterized protein n=1 Tax=Kryptoperidinium triquetrum TaxID=66468 RepID=Q5ENJ3_KRYTR|nr:unknown protein [Heterocapsa triquetra]
MAARQARLPGAVIAVLAVLFCASAFVPAPQTQQVDAQALLRGSAAAAAVSAAPLAAQAADELIDYNYAGEWTPLFIGGYMALTLAYTGVSFISYLILTKLKII